VPESCFGSRLRSRRSCRCCGDRCAGVGLPPSNDDISNATVIASLPLRDTLDISQATPDFATDSSFCVGSDHSVWYSFTPANSEQVAFDPSASNGLIAIDVFTGSPGASGLRRCVVMSDSSVAAP
jgi:hypothetical protein